MFTWKPIYSEIANKILDFQENNAELVQLLKKLLDKGLMVSKLTDRFDKSGKEGLLREIDPFTFLANFNRGITDANRRAIVDALKNEWGLTSALPQDFTGLPIMSTQSSWFMPYGYSRIPEHVPTLWSFYRAFLQMRDYPQLDTDAFDKCIKLKYVGLATLTMGMFWCRPEVWIALDSKNKDYAMEELAVLTVPKSGAEYVEWMKEVRQATNLSPCELSHAAHLRATKPPTGKFGAPFDRMFSDRKHADLVLDNFGRVLEELDGSESNDLLVCSARSVGKQNARISIIYGRWMVFRYERKSGVGSYELIVPAKSPIAKNHSMTFQYKSEIDGESFILVRVSEDAFHAEPEQYFGAMATPIFAIKEKCVDWTGTPYASFHVVGLVDAALDSSYRAELLAEGLESSEYDNDFWLLAPGKNAVYWEQWQIDGVGAIGWEEIGELNQYDSKESIAESVAEVYPNDGPQSAAAMLWSFANEMKPGDIVFAKKGLFKVCGWGIVTGDYAYDDSRDDYFHTIPIEWKSNEELAMPAGIQLAMQTLTRVTSKRSFISDMAIRYPGIPGLASQGGGIGPALPPPPPPPQQYSKTEALADLFLSESAVDRIISLLRRKKNIVLQGAPGTGKTFVARRLAYLLIGIKDETRVPMVQFHQSTTYEDFIQGFRPNGDNGFNLQNGSFYEFVTRAQESPDSDFVFVIDEINRGNLSKIFGELMMLVEADKRGPDFALPLTYAAERQEAFFVPSNVYLIGTMNTADRSLSLVDYALRRRFAFVELEPGFATNGFQDFLAKKGASEQVIEEIRARMKKLNELIAEDSVNLGKGYRIGHSFFVPNEGQEPNTDWLNEIIEFEIAPLIEEYWCDDPSQLAKAIQIVLGHG